MKRYKRARIAAITFGLSVLALALAGCDGGAEGATSPSTTVLAATTEPAEAGNALQLVVCYDASSSYPAVLRSEAIDSVGTVLSALIAPGFQGAHVHERWITHKTRSAEAELVDWRIGNVPDRPTRATDPVAPIPPDPSDPIYLYDKEAYERAFEEYETKLGDWQSRVNANQDEFDEANRQVDAAIAAAQDAVRSRTEFIHSATIPLAEGSDIGGCFQKAGDILSRAEGRRVAIVVSDMAIYGTQDFVGVDFSGIETHAIYFYCEQAAECGQRTQEWAALLGSFPINYYDPDEDISEILKEDK